MLFLFSAIGRYKEGLEGSLLSLAIGMILADFHIWGMVCVDCCVGKVG